MAVNGTELLNDPLGTIFSGFTNLFEKALGPGGGNVFFLFPIIILTVGIYFKTQNPVMPSMFLLASCGILGSGAMFAGMYTLSILFYIFAALGMVGMVVSLIFQR